MRIGFPEVDTRSEPNVVVAARLKATTIEKASCYRIIASVISRDKIGGEALQLRARPIRFRQIAILVEEALTLKGADCCFFVRPALAVYACATVSNHARKPGSPKLGGLVDWERRTFGGEVDMSHDEDANGR